MCVCVCDRSIFCLQAQLEVKQLSAECHRLKEEGERRANELERELRSSEQLHSRERDSFTVKVREQEACVQSMPPPHSKLFMHFIWSCFLYYLSTSTDRGA